MLIGSSIMALACQHHWKKKSHSMIPKTLFQFIHFTVYQCTSLSINFGWKKIVFMRNPMHFNQNLQNSNVYRVINYGARTCQRHWKKKFSQYDSQTICFNSFKHFNQLHHFTVVFQFFSFKTQCTRNFDVEWSAVDKCHQSQGNQ